MLRTIAEKLGQVYCARTCAGYQASRLAQYIAQVSCPCVTGFRNFAQVFLPE